MTLSTLSGSSLSGTVTESLEPRTGIITVASGWAKESKGECNPYLLTEVCTVPGRVECSREARLFLDAWEKMVCPLQPPSLLPPGISPVKINPACFLAIKQEKLNMNITESWTSD